MKTLSGKFNVIALVAIGVGAVFAFRAFAQQPASAPSEPPASKATFVLKIKNPTAVTDVGHFKQVLKELKTQLYSIHLKHGGGQPDEDINSGSGGAKLDIKTDKAVTSELGKSGELTAIQLHATIQIASLHASDIKKVLGELP
jgi:hypothetical protein